MNWLFFFLLFTLAIPSAFSQETPAREVPIPLNRHYFKVAPGDSAQHVYDLLVSYAADSAKLERILTRDGRVHRVVMTQPPREEYHERVTDQYNEYQELEWRKTENLHNGKFLTLYYFDNEAVGQVLADSDSSFQIARNGTKDPIAQGFNDFEPRIVGDTEQWQQFVFKNFRLSAKLYPKEPVLFWVAVLVNSHGMVEKVEWANPSEENRKAAAQFVRVVQLWGNNFHPALDSFGQPVSKWLMIPFVFGGGVELMIKAEAIGFFRL